MVRSAAAHVTVDSAAVRMVAVLIAEDSVAALAAVVLTAADTAVAAEWVDTDKSEHQFPDFRIRHPRNLAH